MGNSVQHRKASTPSEIPQRKYKGIWEKWEIWEKYVKKRALPVMCVLGFVLLL
jgi:hypothetical protein